MVYQNDWKSLNKSFFEWKLDSTYLLIAFQMKDIILFDNMGLAHYQLRHQRFGNSLVVQ